MKEVKANYNMIFDNGSFQKDHVYKYRNREDFATYFVTTEEGKEQPFYETELNMFFTILKN